MGNLRLVLGFAVASVVVACGGKVVVDVGNGNAGGGTGTAGGGQGGAGAGVGTNVGGASCFTPPDPASLTFCGGSGVGAGGTDFSCENDFCDAQGNIWAAVCQATTCQCKFNGDVVCTCALNGPGNFCTGTPTCCPLPKL